MSPKPHPDAAVKAFVDVTCFPQVDFSEFIQSQQTQGLDDPMERV